jgi:adsorption protein B
MFSIELMPYLFLLLKGLLILVALVFFASGVDDFFIDLYFAYRSIYRQLFVLPKYRPLTEAQMNGPSEQPIAVMIPAWQEALVIRPMLKNTILSLNYAHYHIFVGTYPNDPDTGREVEAVREQFDNVHRIVCPKDGPTNKADCLNWVYQGIRLFEEEHNLKFALFVIEDSEDLVHPLALELYNYLVPRKDMIQLVVLPLEGKWSNFTEGHYIDEFSEMHYKNLVVRESLSRSLPSAGVGCAFSRRAIEAMAKQAHNQLFNIDTLTEDYDFGVRMKSLGLKAIFVKQAIERVVSRQSLLTGKWKQVKIKEFIAIRGPVPKTFWSSVRQKSRWIVGICLQGWANLGWQGDLSTKYMLFRDRKGLLTGYFNMLGYVVVCGVLLYWLCLHLSPGAYRYPALVEPGTWLFYLIMADTFFMFVRIYERLLCVFHFYGLGQALLSVPRFFWANVINFFACTRALYLYARYLATGKIIAWDKTDHIYPSEEELKSYRRKLGDLLLERRFITMRQLEEALALQKTRSRPLGAILLEMGLLQENELMQVLGQQLRLSVREIDPETIPLEALRLLPKDLAVHYSVVPLELHKNGHLLLAATNLLSREQLAALEQVLNRPVNLCLTYVGDLAFAIRRGYARLDEPQPGVPAPELGQLLLRRGLITAAQLQDALRAQRRSYARLGDILLQEGMLTPERLQEALDLSSAEADCPLGDFLVRHEYLTCEQLQRALQLQLTRFRRLGEVLVDLHLVGRETMEEVLREQERVV